MQLLSSSVRVNEGGSHGALTPSAAERGAWASSLPPLSGGKAGGSALLHPEGEGRETLGSSNAQGPARPCGFSIWVQHPQIQAGEQGTSLLPPSPSTTVAPQCPGHGWRPPAHGAGRGRGRSFHVINMVTEFARGQSWE